MSEKKTISELELANLLEKSFANDPPAIFTEINDTFLLSRYLEKKEAIDNFEIDNSDIWICGFPKSGTTWISEISWLIANDLDYEKAKEDDFVRTAVMDLIFLFDVEQAKAIDPRECTWNAMEYCLTLKKPRSIKSHLPFGFLPKQIVDGTKKPRIIYVARNPMDVCVSYYYQCANFENFRGTFGDFLKLFIHHKLNYCPQYKHVISFWEKRSSHNILFLTYEEMKKDIRSVIEKVAKFLGKTLQETDIDGLIKYTSFEQMKKNPAVNKENPIKHFTENGGKILAPFIREGKSKNYGNMMSEEEIEEFETLMKKWFEETGVDFGNIEQYIFSK